MKQVQSDASQKFDIAVGFCFEFYRSLMAAFLIMFVPQKCGDHTCGTLDNMLVGKSELYDAQAPPFNLLSSSISIMSKFQEKTSD